MHAVDEEFQLLCYVMQEKEKVMRAGGREKYGIKIIESAGNNLERMLGENVSECGSL